MMDGPSRHPSAEEQPRGWLLLSPHAVPERWRHRATDVSLIPLIPDEASRVLAGQAVHPSLDPADAAIAELLARGITIQDIAREVGMSVRGVQRRLTSLRQRFDVDTTADLRALFAGWGFGALA